MTLRDLTVEQLDASVKRCEKERIEFFRTLHPTRKDNDDYTQHVWNVAYNAGFKAGLEIPRKP